MALSLKVHDYKVVEGPEGPRTKLVRRNPYSRLVHSNRNEKGEVVEQHTPVNVQDGSFYSDGGERIPVDEVPGWVWDALEKMTPENLQALKIDPSKDRPKKSSPSKSRQILTDQKE